MGLDRPPRGGISSMRRGDGPQVDDESKGSGYQECYAVSFPTSSNGFPKGGRPRADKKGMVETVSKLYHYLGSSS